MVAPAPAQPADPRPLAQIIPFPQSALKSAPQAASCICVSTARNDGRIDGRCDGPAPVLSLAGNRAVTHPMVMPAASEVRYYTVDRTDPDWTPRLSAQAQFITRNRARFDVLADWVGIAGLYLAGLAIGALALKGLAAVARLGWL